MGLLDTIDRLNHGGNQPISSQLLPDPPPEVTSLPKTTVTKTALGVSKESDPAKWQPSPVEIAERRRILNRKPERLSFLAPCPVCHGRSFLHIDGGGFVCRTCQPGFFGYPVEATGPDRQAPNLDPELLPAGESRDIPAIRQPVDNQPPEEALAHFAVAWPWVKKHRSALLAAGWTMAALVRRARYRWPCGPWGLAWLPVWSKPGVMVTLVRDGKIQFAYESNGRTIKQIAKFNGRTKAKKRHVTRA